VIDFTALIDKYGPEAAMLAVLLLERITIMKRLIALLERIDARLADKGSKVLVKAPAAATEEDPGYGGTD